MGFLNWSAGSDDAADHRSPTSSFCARCQRVKRGDTYFNAAGYRRIRWVCDYCDNPESEAEWDPRLHEAPESD